MSLLTKKTIQIFPVAIDQGFVQCHLQLSWFHTKTNKDILIEDKLVTTYQIDMTIIPIMNFQADLNEN